MARRSGFGSLEREGFSSHLGFLQNSTTSSLESRPIDGKTFYHHDRNGAPTSSKGVVSFVYLLHRQLPSPQIELWNTGRTWTRCFTAGNAVLSQAATDDENLGSNTLVILEGSNTSGRCTHREPVDSS